MKSYSWGAMASSPNDGSGLVPIYVRLLDEGTPTSRPTHAERIGNDLFKLLPTPNYDPNDEHWEFPPGSIVRAKTMEYDGKDYLLAVTP